MSSLAFQENIDPVKPVVLAEVKGPKWQPPSENEMLAFFIDKARSLNNRRKFSSSDIGLFRGMAVLATEEKRKDRYLATVKDLLATVKANYGVVK